MRIWLSYVEICTKSKTTESTNDIPIEFSILCNENRQYKKKGLSPQVRETLWPPITIQIKAPIPNIPLFPYIPLLTFPSHSTSCLRWELRPGCLGLQVHTLISFSSLYWGHWLRPIWLGFPSTTLNSNRLEVAMEMEDWRECCKNIWFQIITIQTLYMNIEAFSLQITYGSKS